MEIISSFFNNIKDKLTNPFFGTLILVLLIDHWELWYSFFNFDSDCTLNDKILLIKSYSEKHLTFLLFTCNILQAILFMFLGYLIIVATRSLVMWVEFGLMPQITGLIVNKNVVRKTEYDQVVTEREEYFDLYEEQRKNVRIFSKTIDEQTEQIKQKDQNLLEQSNTITKSIRELDQTKNTLANFQIENSNKTKEVSQLHDSIEKFKQEDEFKTKQLSEFGSLFFGSNSKLYYSSPDKFPPEILQKVKELKDEKMWKTFLAVCNFLTNGGTIGGEAITQMINKEMAVQRGGHEELTAIGKIIWYHRHIFEGDGNYQIF